MASTSAWAVGSRRWTISLWASPRISPSRTTTAPTGTSSRTAAARASRSAASMPVRSAGDGVPLRTGRLGRGRVGRGRVREGEVPIERADHDRGAFRILPFQQLEGDRILQLPLDHALERPGAVDRVIPLAGKKLA